MADFSIKAHDRYPSIKAALKTGTSALDLTDADKVDFVMRQVAGGPLRTNSLAVIDDPVAGIVHYDWSAQDTATPGQFQAEWQITWNNGYQQTVPTLSYHTVEILADLDGE